MGEVSFQLPDDLRVDWITYDHGPIKPDEDEKETIRRALAQPIGSQPLKTLTRNKRKAVIIISDITRLCPSRTILPEILKELYDAGLDKNSIRIVVALGMHRKQTEKELEELTGVEVYREIPVLNHSPLVEDCIHMGTTSSGTPIEIFREVVESDLRIAVGNIEPHRLVGMSGGIKALVPGVASQRAIEHNHALSARYPAEVGDIHNRVHRDLLEFLEKVPIHFIINVIADHRQRILAAVAGDVIQAHQRGILKAREIFLLPVEKTYDTVIVSAGGHPKDMQLYQAVKTLQNASEITRTNGTILLIAQCEEGFGSGIFQYWMETIQNRERIVQKLRRQFVLGAHKIEHIHRILQNKRVCLFSGLPRPIVELIGFEYVTDLQQTVDNLIRKGPDRVAILPFGALTFPKVSRQKN